LWIRFPVFYHIRHSDAALKTNEFADFLKQILYFLKFLISYFRFIRVWVLSKLHRF